MATQASRVGDHNVLLNAILKDEHREQGLSLVETGDMVQLLHYGRCVYTFSARGVFFTSIQKEADRFLGGDAVAAAVKNGGIEFEKK